MKKMSRNKRKVVKWQIEDQGANPLTARGRKWIKKEIALCDANSLRNKLEGQRFEHIKKQPTYWEWMEKHQAPDETGCLYEYPQANPDVLSDE